MAASNRFKKSVIAGLIVILPLLVSGLTLVWVAGLIEETMSPLLDWFLGRRVPGLGFASALVLVTIVGLVATTVVGSRILGQGESIMARIPLFKDIYVPVKQLLTAFSPDNESGFKRAVLVPYARRHRTAVGFLTREFGSRARTATRPHGRRSTSRRITFIWEPFSATRDPKSGSPI
jgi:uncharacterized membrane protein